MSISCRRGDNFAIAVATARTPLPRAAAVPPHAYFVGSAIFHYLGPSFAVLLFARVDVLGVAWLRIASAAAVFACWRRPCLRQRSALHRLHRARSPGRATRVDGRRRRTGGGDALRLHLRLADRVL